MSRGTAGIAAGGPERSINPTMRNARLGAMPLSISVVITSCAPVRALRKPGMNPYAAPAMVPPSTATTRASSGGRCPATSIAVMKAPRPPMRNCPSTPRLNRPALERHREAQAGEDEWRGADQGLGDGSKGCRDVVGVAALDRGNDASRVADRPGEHRRVAVEHAGERAADRRERIGADLSQVLEVGQHDDDRAQEEGREQGECRVNGATELIADSLHVAQCRRRASSAPGSGRPAYDPGWRAALLDCVSLEAGNGAERGVRRTSP